MKNILYSWKFEDKKNRSQLWYIIAFSIVIGLTIWGFITKQYGMSFIVLLLSGVLFYVENNSEDHIEVKISDTGMYIGDTFYDYSSIRKYTIGYQNDVAYLLRLHLSKKGIAILDLKISNEIVTEVQNQLNNFVEDGGTAEISHTDKIITLLKL